MKRLVIALVALAGCGSFRAAEEGPDASGGGADASADAGAEGATSGSKHCRDAIGAAYCEDFSAREDADEVVAAFPNGAKPSVENSTWAMVDGPLGDPRRALQITLAATGQADSQLVFPFASAPPPRLRLFARLRFDEISDVDVVALGFTRSSAQNEYVYVTLISGQLRLAEFDPAQGVLLADGGRTVTASASYDLELRVELASGNAALFLGGGQVGALVLSRVVVSDGMTGYRLQYGLFSLNEPRARARVTYDDIELRVD